MADIFVNTKMSARMLTESVNKVTSNGNKSVPGLTVSIPAEKQPVLHGVPAVGQGGAHQGQGGQLHQVTSPSFANIVSRNNSATATSRVVQGGGYRAQPGTDALGVQGGPHGGLRVQADGRSRLGSQGGQKRERDSDAQGQFQTVPPRRRRQVNHGSSKVDIEEAGQAAPIEIYVGNTTPAATEDIVEAVLVLRPSL